jgi:response regulator RpfG family c-di-GMP phosphodiesterase
MPEGNKKIGERMIEAGLISRDSLDKALELQKSSGLRLGESLLKLRLLSEQSFLRFLATEFKTRYVSSEKLAKLKVPTEVLDLVPVRMAEQNVCMPLMLDEDESVLTLVMAEPQNDGLIDEIRLITEVREIQVFIATRSAITAAIKKYYYGDTTAFEGFEKDGPTSSDVARLSDYYEKRDSRSVNSAEIRMDAGTGMIVAGGPTATIATTSLRQAIESVQRSSLLSDNDFIETLNIMVGLLELRRKDFRSHSPAVAKTSRIIANRLGLSGRDTAHVTIAAYLHDLGKRPDRHLTALSIAKEEEYRQDARRYFKAPIKLFETVHLPVQVNSILAQLYEAFDGSGLPSGTKGEDIPAGARILTVVDAFEDLTKNPANAYGQLFQKEAAFDMMHEHAGQLFDPAVLEILRQVHSGELLRQRLISEGQQVFIGDGDEGLRTDLSDTLSKLGVFVSGSPRSDSALDAAHRGDVDLLIVDVALKPDDGFIVAATLKADPATAGVPIIFLADKTDETMVEKARGLGGEIMARPVDPDELAKRILELLQSRMENGAPSRRVIGTLDEMALPDLLRTLGVARRTGQLIVRSAGKTGEVHLSKGRVVNCVCAASKGEAGFEAIMDFDAGDFTLDPNYLVLDTPIDKELEVLLREAQLRKKRSAAAAAPREEA